MALQVGDVEEALAFYGRIFEFELRGRSARMAFIDRLKARGIQAVFHYVPLHSAPYGRTVGRADGALEVTEDASERLVRLPLWLGIEDQLETVIREVVAAAE